MAPSLSSCSTVFSYSLSNPDYSSPLLPCLFLFVAFVTFQYTGCLFAYVSCLWLINSNQKAEIWSVSLLLNPKHPGQWLPRGGHSTMFSERMNSQRLLLGSGTGDGDVRFTFTFCSILYFPMCLSSFHNKEKWEIKCWQSKSTWTWGRNLQHQTIRLPSSFRDQWRILEERPALDLTSEKKWNDTSEMAHSPSLEAQRVCRLAVSLQKSSFILCNVCPAPMDTMKNFSMGKKPISRHSKQKRLHRPVCPLPPPQQGQAGGHGVWASLGRDRQSVPMAFLDRAAFLIHYRALWKLDKDYRMPCKSTGLQMNGSINLSQLLWSKIALTFFGVSPPLSFQYLPFLPHALLPLFSLLSEEQLMSH